MYIARGDLTRISSLTSRQQTLTKERVGCAREREERVIDLLGWVHSRGSNTAERVREREWERE